MYVRAGPSLSPPTLPPSLHNWLGLPYQMAVSVQAFPRDQVRVGHFSGPYSIGEKSHRPAQIHGGGGVDSTL